MILIQQIIWLKILLLWLKKDQSVRFWYSLLRRFSPLLGWHVSFGVSILLWMMTQKTKNCSSSEMERKRRAPLITSLMTKTAAEMNPNSTISLSWVSSFSTLLCLVELAYKFLKNLDVSLVLFSTYFSVKNLSKIVEKLSASFVVLRSFFKVLQRFNIYPKSFLRMNFPKLCKLPVNFEEYLCKILNFVFFMHVYPCINECNITSFYMQVPLGSIISLWNQIFDKSIISIMSDFHGHKELPEIYLARRREDTRKLG